MHFSVKANIDAVRQEVDDFKRGQLRYATMLALNRTAFAVQEEERDSLFNVFDDPTPWTAKAFRVEKATKADLTATVYIDPERAKYLSPYIDGGKRFLGNKKAMIKPVNARVNRYGNLPRGAMSSAKGKASVFVGSVKTKAGVEPVGGVWQRTRVGKGRGLKLLMRFQETTEVSKRFEFERVAFEKASKVFDKEFGRAFAQAIATAR